MADTSQQTNQPFQWRLILHPDSDAQEFSIGGDSFSIGRAEGNDLVIDDSQISKYHARLSRQGTYLLIEDLETVNGTRVNDTPLTRPYVLQPDDSIQLGEHTLQVIREAVVAPQSRQETQVHAVPAPAERRNLAPWLILGIALLILLIFGIAGAGMFLSSQEASSIASAPTEEPTIASLGGPEIAINQAPAQDVAIRANQSVTVQATASDEAGVTRVELWVNDEKVDEVVSQLAQDVPSMTVGFQWESEAPGSYDLEIRAYNQSGAVSILPVAAVNIAGDTPTPMSEPSDTPSPTPTVASPSPTATETSTPISTVTPVTTVPSLILKAPILVARAGPGLSYPGVGRLDQQTQPEIVGQAEVNQEKWWQISFPSAPGGVAWVPADPDLSIALNAFNVPEVAPPATATSVPTDTPPPTVTSIPPTATPRPPTATPTVTPPPPTVVRAPDGKTLLIVGNRSLINQPARLTLSGGKSVGGGLEIDPRPNEEVQLVLEPDFYRAVWSAPWRSFARGADFTAVPGKVVVMWIVPEEGRTDTEVYGELIINPTPTPSPSPSPTTVPPPFDQYVAPSGKALLVAENRSVANEYARLTLSGGSFGGGREITLDANTEIPLELEPGNYRAIWAAPANGGFTAGRDFSVIAGEVILSWVIPEDKRVLMQFPGQQPFQVNN